MIEERSIRERRLRMRSIRRGIREMDLILSDFVDRNLSGLDEAELGTYEALLQENDHDIYTWILGTAQAPVRYDALIRRIAAGAKGVVKPGPA